MAMLTHMLGLTETPFDGLFSVHYGVPLGTLAPLPLAACTHLARGYTCLFSLSLCAERRGLG
jgi:hypothetical protein